MTKFKVILQLLFFVNITFAQNQTVLTVNNSHSGKIRCLLTSDNDKYLFSGSADNTIKLWDIKSASLIKTFEGHSNPIININVSKDLKKLYSISSDSTIKIWDIEKNICLKTFELAEYNIRFHDAVFSPDNNYAIISSYYEKKVIVYNIQEEKIVNTYDFDHYISDLKISFKGDKVLFVGKDSFYLLDYKLNILNDYHPKYINQSYIRYTKEIDCINFSPDDKYAIYGLEDGSVEVMELSNESNKYILREKDNKRIISISFSPNNNDLIISKRLDTELWKYQERKLEKLYDYYNSQHSVSFTKNGEYVFFTTFFNEIDLVNVQNASIISKLGNSPLEAYKAIFSPDLKYMLCGLHSNNYRLWDIQNNRIAKSFGRSHRVYIEVGQHIYPGYENSIIDFSKDGLFFIIGDPWDYKKNESIYTAQKIIIFDSKTKRATDSIEGEHFTYAEITDDNNNILFKLFKGDALMSYQIATKKVTPQNELFPKKTNQYSMDGKYSVSCSQNSVNLLEKKLFNKKQIKNTYIHKEVQDAYFSPDGSKLISCSLDGSIKVWDINSQNELITAFNYDTTDWVVVAPSGRFDGSENGIKNLYFVKGLEIIPLESLYEQYFTPNLLARVLAGEEFDEPEIKINNLALPPLVKITAPESNAKLNSQVLTVTIEATDQGGGIDEIRLFVNGKLVETTQRGFKPVAQNNQTKTKTFTISLSNGKNIIKATAFNNQRTESIADEITVYYEGAKATSDLYLFVIGVDKYRNPEMNLNYAVADATGFKNAIFGNTSTIFGSVNTSFITNEKATKENILKEFETIQSKMKQEDVLIFYYAGHGAMSVEDNPLYYLVLYDVHQLYGNNELLNNKALSVEEIKNICMKLPAQKQLFVLDACQSGGVEKAVMRGNAEQKAIAVLSRATGTYWLTASGTDEYATEFEQLGHGVFTYAILEGLKGEADGGSKDKQITIKELDAFIQDKVPELSEKYKGQPQFPKSYGGGDDFPLIIIK